MIIIILTIIYYKICKQYKVLILLYSKVYYDNKPAIVWEIAGQPNRGGPARTSLRAWIRCALWRKFGEPSLFF